MSYSFHLIQPRADGDIRDYARAEMDAIALGQEVIYLNDDELKQHSVEVFDVERPWQNFKARLPKSP